jgi:hypothetical protein
MAKNSSVLLGRYFVPLFVTQERRRFFGFNSLNKAHASLGTTCRLEGFER